MTDQSNVPDEVTRWNWGAFFLSWIWGIRFGVWKSLLVFIPLFNIIWIFVLGAKGGRWAWESHHWRDVNEFKASQRRWAIAGLIVFVIGGFAAGFGLKQGAHALEPLANKSFMIVKQDPRVQQFIGPEASMKRGSIALNFSIHANTNSPTQGNLGYSITGAKGKGQVTVLGQKSGNDWRITSLRVSADNHMLDLTPHQINESHP